MNSLQFQDRRIPRLGLGVMLVLLLLAMIFWRERTWILDVAFQTFLMIKDGTVQVMVYRFGAATVQSLPLLGIKLGAPLAVISWLYSISFQLHFLLFFSLAAFGFKREDVALGIALLYTAMTFDGFYWQTSELQQGLGFLMLSWAAMLRYPNIEKWWHYLAWGLTIIALAFYHPLVFMPFYFMLIWLWWRPQAGVSRRSLLFWAGFMLAVLVVKQIWFQNWYDLQKTAQFKAHLIADFPNYFNYPAYQAFLKNALLYWWGLPLLLLLASGHLFRKRQYLAIGFLWLVCCGFVMLTAIGDPETPFRFYAEVNYYPLLTFVLVPVILQLIPAFFRLGENKAIKEKHQEVKTYSLPLIGLSVFLSLRLLGITLHGSAYTERVDYLRELTATASPAMGERQWTDPTKLDQETLLMDWGLPYETLLQSATETERPLSLLPISVTPDKATELRADSLFVTPWAAFPLSKVNANPYWELPQVPYGGDWE